MSYTVLARRYRSGTFDEVVGQSHVAQTLKKAIASGRIAHAYLFCGTRGTGKTSTARILATALNCHAFPAATPEPCGKCESCKAIARGDDIDVIEIDAASNTGVDSVRDIIENSQYRPVAGRYKIYIIDEVHMLSKSAFNALLKTLEEPPSHVKFILATTEPEKVLPTILSRCQRYDFRNIPTREIAAHLASVCKQEGIKADADALLLVAKAGAGSMRDALSLLDRLLSLGEKTLNVDMIEQLLGLPKSQLVFDLADAIGRGDVKSTLQQADAMVQSGLSIDTFLASLIDHLRNLLILNTCGGDSELVEVPGLSIADLAKQAARFDAVALTQDIALLEELRRQARQSQAGRALLDATLVRMTLAEQFSSVADLLTRLEGGSSSGGPVQKKNGEVTAGRAQFALARPPVEEAVVVEAPPTDDAPASPSAPTVAAPPSLDFDDDAAEDALPAVGRVWDEDAPKKSLATIMAEDKRADTARQAAAPKVIPPSIRDPFANVEAVDPADLPAVWQASLALLSEKGQALYGMISQGQFAGVEDGRAVIRYGTDTFVKILDKAGKRELVSDAFSKVLSQSVGVRFEVDPSLRPAAAPRGNANSRSNGNVAPRPAVAPASTPEPPATPSIRLTPELRAELESDPLIRAAMESLGANIVKVE